MLFSKNVNYFNNKDANADLSSLGINNKNANCFKLYNGSTKIPISVSLLDSDDDGGNDSVVYTTTSGSLSNSKAKNLINIKISQTLDYSTTYKIVISGDLSSNSSDTLGKNVNVYFTTEDASSGGSSTTTSTTTSTITSSNSSSVVVAMSPSISGKTASLSPSDNQISSAIKSLNGDSNALVTFQVQKSDTGDSNEVDLNLTKSQVSTLSANAEKVACVTPVGTVIIPKAVLDQTSSNVTLSITKVSDDTFTVTLKDGDNTISSLSGRTILELPVSITGSSSDVLTHKRKYYEKCICIRQYGLWCNNRIQYIRNFIQPGNFYGYK